MIQSLLSELQYIPAAVDAFAAFRIPKVETIEEDNKKKAVPGQSQPPRPCTYFSCPCLPPHSFDPFYRQDVVRCISGEVPQIFRGRPGNFVINCFRECQRVVSCPIFF
jgi:hypothetical protein